MEILTLFTCYSTLLSTVTIGHLAIIAQAILTLTGRVTMSSMVRWTGGAISYRTIQRFFATTLPWVELLVGFFRTQLFEQDEEYIVAGDTTTVTKSGKKTHGLDRFFSGVLEKVVWGVEFLVLSIVGVKSRKSYPLAVQQTVRSEEEKAELKRKREERFKARKKRKKKPVGRRKGVKNKGLEEVGYSAELQRLNALVKRLVQLLRLFVKVKYLVLDGHYAHHQAVLLAQENELELISKMRCDAALYEKYEGEYGGTGRPNKYGKKIDYNQIPKKYVEKSEFEEGVLTNYYAGKFWHRKFKHQLKVVIIEKIKVKEGKVGRVILMSSELELGWEKVIEYYCLRFQIEFNFRDAKQYFGLEDFMNTTERGVENAANLSFLMVLLSGRLLAQRKASCVGINDLKAQFRGAYYALETLKIVEPKAEENLIEKVKAVISRIGSIHRYCFSNSSA